MTLILPAFLLSILLVFPLQSYAQERTEGQQEGRQSGQQEGQQEGESGKLKDFGKEVERTANEPNREEHPKSDEELALEDESDAATVELIADILHSIFESAIREPRDTVEVPDEYHTFAQYPYAEEGHGLYKLGGAKDFSLNLKANYYREAPDLMGGGARLRVSPYRCFSAEAYVTLLSEQLKSRTDRILLTSFFVNYHVVRENVWTMWIGFGRKGVIGAGANEAALSGNATVEVYPVDPISFHANFSWGAYSELFATLNYHLNRYTFSVGYQALVAGKADLHGFLLGSSLYF